MPRCWIGLPTESPYLTVPDFLLGVRRVLWLTVGDMYVSLFVGFAVFFLLFALRLVLRDRWIAGVLFVLIMTAPRTVGSDNWWVMAIFMVVSYLCFLFALTHFGLLTAFSPSF